MTTETKPQTITKSEIDKRRSRLIAGLGLGPHSKEDIESDEAERAGKPPAEFADIEEEALREAEKKQKVDPKKAKEDEARRMAEDAVPAKEPEVVEETPKEGEKSTETPPKASEEQPATKTPPAASEAPKKPRKKKESPSLESIMDEDAVVERAARKVVEAVRKDVQPPPAPQAPPATPVEELDLTDDERGELKVYERMAQLYPNHKDLPTRMKRFWKGWSQRMEKWEKDNPGEDFDENSAENKAWIEKNSPPVPSDEFEEAEGTLKIDPRIEKKLTETEKRIDEKLKRVDQVEFESKMKAEMPEILGHVHQTVIAMVDQASPEMAKLLEVDGEKIINTETLKKLQEEDPFAYRVLSAEAEKLAWEVQELEKMTRFEANYPANPAMTVKLKNTNESFAPHRSVLTFANELEQELAKAPAEETERDGRDFMRYQDYKARTDRINQSDLGRDRKEAALRDLNSRVWVLAPEDVQRSLIADRAHRASDALEDHNKALAKRGARRSEQAADPPPEPRKKPQSVTTSAASDISDGGPGGKKSDALTAEQVDRAMWG